MAAYMEFEFQKFIELFPRYVEKGKKIKKFHFFLLPTMQYHDKLLMIAVFLEISSPIFSHSMR